MPSSVQESNKDGLMAAHEDIAGIDVVKGENNTRIIKLTDSKGKEAFITVNDHNQIIEYENNELTSMPENFLRYTYTLEKITTPHVQTMGQNSLQINKLRELNTPELKIMQKCCLEYCTSLTSVALDSLEQMGSACFEETSLTRLSLPKAKIIGSDSLRVSELKSFSGPVLEHLGQHCFSDSNKITRINTPNLKTIGDDCFSSKSLFAWARLGLQLKAAGTRVLKYDQQQEDFNPEIPPKTLTATAAQTQTGTPENNSKTAIHEEEYTM